MAQRTCSGGFHVLSVVIIKSCGFRNTMLCRLLCQQQIFEEYCCPLLRGAVKKGEVCDILEFEASQFLRKLSHSS
jgi:hypothetical protein